MCAPVSSNDHLGFHYPDGDSRSYGMLTAKAVESGETILPRVAGKLSEEGFLSRLFENETAFPFLRIRKLDSFFRFRGSLRFYM